MTVPQLRVRRAVLLSWAALLALVVFRQFAQHSLPSAMLWSLAMALPLLLCARGLWLGQRYTHKWATLCVLPYFVVGVTEGVANVQIRTWALSVLGVSLLWFFALIAYLRITEDAPVARSHQQ